MSSASACPEALLYPDVARRVATRPFSWVSRVSSAPPDSLNLEALRTMDAARKQLQEPMAKAHIGSHPETKRLETLAAYLPLLQSLLDRADALGDFGVGLKLEWSTMQTPTKFLQVEALAAEHGMVLMLYGATLCADAAWELRQNGGGEAAGPELGQERANRAVTALRTAAGVFEHARERFGDLLPTLRGVRPDELVPSMAACMRDVALAQAQAVVARRAYERSGGTALVASLYKGANVFVASAYASLREHIGEYNLIPPRLSRYLRCCEHALKAMALQVMAEEARGREELGLALAYVERASAALERAAGEASDDTADWGAPLVALRQALERVRGECQRENNMVFYQPVPQGVPKLPEPKTMVSPVAFRPAASQQFPEFV